MALDDGAGSSWWLRLWLVVLAPAFAGDNDFG